MLGRRWVDVGLGRGWALKISRLPWAPPGPPKEPPRPRKCSLEQGGFPRGTQCPRITKDAKGPIEIPLGPYGGPPRTCQARGLPSLSVPHSIRIIIRINRRNNQPTLHHLHTTAMQTLMPRSLPIGAGGTRGALTFAQKRNVAVRSAPEGQCASNLSLTTCSLRLPCDMAA